MTFSFKVLKNLMRTTNFLVTCPSSNTYSFKALYWWSNKSGLNILKEFKNIQAKVYFFSEDLQLISLKSYFCISKSSRAKHIPDK